MGELHWRDERLKVGELNGNDNAEMDKTAGQPVARG